MAAEKQDEESVGSALYQTGETPSTVVSQMEVIETRGRLLREQYVVEVRQKGEFFDLGTSPSPLCCHWTHLLRYS